MSSRLTSLFVLLALLTSQIAFGQVTTPQPSSSPGPVRLELDPATLDMDNPSQVRLHWRLMQREGSEDVDVTRRTPNTIYEIEIWERTATGHQRIIPSSALSPLTVQFDNEKTINLCFGKTYSATVRTAQGPQNMPLRSNEREFSIPSNAPTLSYSFSQSGGVWGYLGNYYDVQLAIYPPAVQVSPLGRYDIFKSTSRPDNFGPTSPASVVANAATIATSVTIIRGAMHPLPAYFKVEWDYNSRNTTPGSFSVSCPKIATNTVNFTPPATTQIRAEVLCPMKQTRVINSNYGRFEKGNCEQDAQGIWGFSCELKCQENTLVEPSRDRAPSCSQAGQLYVSGCAGLRPYRTSRITTEESVRIRDIDWRGARGRHLCTSYRSGPPNIVAETCKARMSIQGFTAPQACVRSFRRHNHGNDQIVIPGEDHPVGMSIRVRNGSCINAR